jgi:hypothetical protein
MRRRAGFQPDETRRTPLKESEDLAASLPLAHHHAVCLIDRMNLENVLCQIKTDCCNIAYRWLPLLVIFDDRHLGTSMPWGAIHPISGGLFHFKQQGNDVASITAYNQCERLVYKLLMVKRSSTDATPGADQAAFSTLRRSSQLSTFPSKTTLLPFCTVMRIALASTSA